MPINVFNRPTNVYDRYGNIAGTPLINTNLSSNNSLLIDTDVTSSPMEMGYIGESRKDPSVYIEDTTEEPFQHQQSRAFNVEDSAWGTFYRAGKRSLIPALAGIAGGALAVATLPISAPLMLTLGVGLAGGIGAAIGAEAIKEKIMPTTEEERRQLQADIQQHPTAAIAGEIAPNLLMFSPRSPFKIARTLSTLGKLEQTGMRVPQVGKSLAAEFGIGAATGVAPAIVEPMVSNIVNNRPLTEGIDAKSLITGAITGGFLTKPRYVTRLGMRFVGKAAESITGRPYSEAVATPEQQGQTPIIGRNVATLEGDHLDYMMKKFSSPAVAYEYGISERPSGETRIGFAGVGDTISMKDDKGNIINKPIKEFVNDILGENGKKYLNDAILEASHNKIVENILNKYKETGGKTGIEDVKGILSDLDKLKELLSQQQAIPLDKDNNPDIDGLMHFSKIINEPVSVDNISKKISSLKFIDNDILHNSALKKIQDDYLTLYNTDKASLTSNMLYPLFTAMLFNDKSKMNIGIQLLNKDIDISILKDVNVVDAKTYQPVADTKLDVFGNIIDSKGQPVHNAVRLESILKLTGKTDATQLTSKDFNTALENYLRIASSGKLKQEDLNNINPYVDIQTILNHINRKYGKHLEGNKITYNVKVDELSQKFLKFLSDIGVKNIKDIATTDTVSGIHNKILAELSNDWNNNLTNLKPKDIYDLDKMIDKHDINSFMDVYNNPTDIRKIISHISKGGAKDVKNNIDGVILTLIHKHSQGTTRDTYGNVDIGIQGKAKGSNNDIPITDSIVDRTAKHFGNNITDITNNRNAFEKVSDTLAKLLDTLKKKNSFNDDIYKHISDRIADYNNLIKLYNIKLGDTSEMFLYHYLKDLSDRSLHTQGKLADDNGTILHNITTAVKNVVEGLHARNGTISNENIAVKDILKSSWDIKDPELFDTKNGILRWKFDTIEELHKFYDGIRNNLKAEIEKAKTETKSKRTMKKLSSVIDNAIDSIKDNSATGKDYTVELKYNPENTNINKDTKEISFLKNYKIDYGVKGDEPLIIKNNKVPSDYALTDIIKNYIGKRFKDDNRALQLNIKKPTANPNARGKDNNIVDVRGNVIRNKIVEVADTGFSKKGKKITIKHNEPNKLIVYKTNDTDTGLYKEITYSLNSNNVDAREFTINSSKTAVITKAELQDLVKVLSNKIPFTNALDTVLNMLGDMGYDTVVYRNSENDYRVITLDPINTIEGEHTAGIKNLINERLENIKAKQELNVQQKGKGKEKELKHKNISLFDLFKYAEQSKESEAFVKENKPTLKNAIPTIDVRGKRLSESEYKAVAPLKQIGNTTSVDELKYISEMYKIKPIKDKVIDESIHISSNEIGKIAARYNIEDFKTNHPEYMQELGNKITAFVDTLNKKGYNYGEEIGGLLKDLYEKNPVAADSLLEVFSRGEAWNINYTGQSYTYKIVNFLRSKGMKDVIFFIDKEGEPYGVTTKYFTGIQFLAGQDIPFHELSHRYISDATKGLFGKETMDLVNSALKVFNGKEENLAGLLGYYSVKRQYRSAIDNVTDDIAAFNRIQLGNGSMLDYVKILSRKIMYEDYKVQTEKLETKIEPTSINKAIEKIQAEKVVAGATDKGNIEVAYAGATKEQQEQARLSSAFYFAKQVRDVVREGFEQAGFLFPTNNYPYNDTDMAAPVDINSISVDFIQSVSGEKIYNPIVKAFLESPKLCSLLTDIAMSYGPPGRYLAKVGKRFFEVRDLLMGRFYNPAMEIVSKLNKEQNKRLYDILQKEYETEMFATEIPDDIKEAYEGIRGILNDVALYHRKYNMPIRATDKKTGKEVLRHMIEYLQYFPQMINTKVLDEIVRHPYSPKSEQYKKDFIEYTAGEYAKGGMSKDKSITLATEIFERIRESSATGQRLARGIKGEFGALHEQMGVGLPESWRVKDLSEIMQRYTSRVAHDMSLHNTIQVDPIARTILGIKKDPWGKEFDIIKLRERLSSIKPELLDIANSIKEADATTIITGLKTALDKLGDDRRLIFYDEQIPDTINSTETKPIYTEAEANNIKQLRDYYNVSMESLKNVDDLLSQIKELNTPNVQLLLRFLYRDLTHSEATFHAATSFTKSLMIGLKAKVRDIFNNVSLMSGYCNVPGKDVLRAMTTTAKFLMDGSALEHAYGTGFAREGGTSNQEWSRYLLEGGGDFTRVLTYLRDLALSITGTEKLEQYSRALAMAMGMSAVHINITNARNGSGRTQQNAIKFLEYYFGEKFNPKKTYTPDEISMAATRLAQQTQGTYDARDLPAWLLESSFTSAMFTLSKWNIGQMNRFTDAVLVNKTGSSLKMLFGSVIGGAMGIYLMEQLFGKKSNISNFKDIYTAYEEKKKQMGLETSDYVRLGFESQYSLLAMLQWSGYCGVMCDVLYSLNSALRKQLPNTYGSPLYEQVTTILDSSVDMINAIKDGENPITVGRDFMFDMLRTQIQTFNALTSFVSAREEQILPDTSRQLQRANNIIEYHKYRRLMGYPVNEVVGRSNRYEGAAIRQFKQAETPQEALKYYEPAIKTAAEKVVYPEDAKRVMQGLAANAIPWSPSIGESAYNISPEFARYYMYIKNRYGEQRANDFYMDYLKTREMNKVRKNMISGTPLGVLIER